MVDRHHRHQPGLEFIEEEVVQMLKGVDLDGNDSIEWKVTEGCAFGREP